jgi:prepilin-type N-terminal cleavage/methylation domain-containing protein
MTRLPHDEGFSLAELLVSLTLLSLIAALIAAGLGTANKLWSRSEETIQAQRIQFEAEAGLTRLLSGLEPLRRPDSRIIDFRGSADSLEGVVALPPHVGLGGLYRLRLFLDAKEHQLALSLAADGKGHGAGGELTTVATGVDRIEIRYLGDAKANGQEAWRTTWQNEERFPKLLAFKIKPLEPKLSWPEFMIAPRLDPADWR